MKFIILTLFALLSAFNCVHAVEVTNLEYADIAVDSRSRVSRQAALSEALKRVFVKNSGSDSVLVHELIKTNIASPQRLLSQFKYIEQDDELILRAIFDHRRVLATLRRAQLPVWGNQRPLTLIWLANEELGKRSIIADESDTSTRQWLAQYADSNALPVLLPLLDLDDLMRVNFNDVKGKFVDVIGNASTRYQTDFFAITSIEPAQEGVKYQLALFPYGSADPFTPALTQLEGTSLDHQSAIGQLMTELTQYFANQYAISASAEQLQAQVIFSDIDNMTELVEIERYFASLSAVKSIQLVKMNQAFAYFRVELFGTEADLVRVLDLETKIGVVDAQSLPEMLEHLNISVNTEHIDQLQQGSPTNIYQWNHKG